MYVLFSRKPISISGFVIHWICEKAGRMGSFGWISVGLPIGGTQPVVVYEPGRVYAVYVCMMDGFWYILISRWISCIFLWGGMRDGLCYILVSRWMVVYILPSSTLGVYDPGRVYAVYVCERSLNTGLYYIHCRNVQLSGRPFYCTLTGFSITKTCKLMWFLVPGLGLN